MPITLEIKITNVNENIKKLFFLAKLPSFSVIIDLLFSLIIALSVFKIFIRTGSKVKVVIKETIKPNVIIHPKSIMGLMPLNIKDKKAHMVVKAV